MRKLHTLQGAAVVFIAVWVIHTLDHARRGIDASPNGVTWLGSLSGILAAVALTLIFGRSPAAPIVATAVFPGIAIGVAASHLLPPFGPFVDPILFDSVSDGWSIIAVVPEIIAAAWVGYVAFRIAQSHGYSWSIPSDEWTETGRGATKVSA